MARHSELRFETGKFLASQLAPMLRVFTLAKATAGEKLARNSAVEAVAFISAGDVTEMSRREIYARAKIMAAVLELDPGKYSAALALYAKALISFVVHNEYFDAKEMAQNAVALIQGTKAKANA